MDLGGCFELYKGLEWSYLQFFKYVGLLGAKCGVPENTVFFIQKFNKMKPLHCMIRRVTAQFISVSTSAKRTSNSASQQICFAFSSYENQITADNTPIRVFTITRKPESLK
jgi:hypothetical protein